MEEAKGKHSLHLHDRETGSVSGVLDVVSFDTEIILLEPTRGMLTIRGEKLHVSRLCLEKGEVDLEGIFGTLEYSEGSGERKKKKGSLVRRLFQ